MKIGFWKLSSAGNTTLFLEERCNARAALDLVSAEQAGFVNFPERRLAMAGGEFCVNACLAFGALLDALGFMPENMNIGGMEVKLQIQGKLPLWQARAEFPRPEHTWETREDSHICHLEGISHALLACDELPAAEECVGKAKTLGKKLNLEDRPAAGIVWWRHLDNRLELRPVVAVPSLATCNLEHACGSASVALALLHGPGKYEIRQPSGKSLIIEILPDSIKVTAEVALLAEGHIWNSDATLG